MRGEGRVYSVEQPPEFAGERMRKMAAAPVGKEPAHLRIIREPRGIGLNSGSVDSEIAETSFPSEFR